MKKRRITRYRPLFQNCAIVTLSFTALFLMLQIISFATGLGGRLTPLVPSTPQAAAVTATDLTGLPLPTSLMITGSYGRSGHLLVNPSSSVYQETTALLQEAFARSEGGIPSTTEAFEKALFAPSVYFDITVPLPLSLLSAIFDVSMTEDFSPRYLLLSQGAEDMLSLFLMDTEGAVMEFPIEGLSQRLENVIALFQSNSALFAFEAGSNMDFLDPLTILTSVTPESYTLSASVPSAINIDNLLSLLDFNAYTNNRYPQSNGTEVVVESPRTLRVRMDGTVIYTSDSPDVPELYQVPSDPEETPSLAACVLSARKLLDVLLSADEFNKTTVYCSSVSEEEGRTTVTFDYMVDGIPIYFSNGAHGFTATIEQGAIMDFTLKSRLYTVSDQPYSLLPLPQAAAVASLQDGGCLTIGYVDRGGETVLPTWLKN